MEIHYPGESKPVSVTITGNAALGTQTLQLKFDHGATTTAAWTGTDTVVGGVHTRPCQFTLNNALRPTAEQSRFQGVYPVVTDGSVIIQKRAGSVAFLG
jgi:hypothetical protein